MNQEWYVLFQPKKTVSAGGINITIQPSNNMFMEVHAIRIRNRNASDRTLSTIKFLGVPIIENHTVPANDEVVLPNCDILATFNKYKGPMIVTDSYSIVVSFGTTQVNEFYDVYLWYKTNLVGDLKTTLSSNVVWVNPLSSAIPVHEAIKGVIE